MRFIHLGALSAALIGCSGGNSAVPCDQNSNCDLSAAGMCIAAPSGHQWCAYPDPSCPAGYRYSTQSVGDGLAGMCVPGGSGSDGGVTIDARFPDAAQGDLIANGQAADVVIGQQTFTTADVNHGGYNAKALNHPSGLALRSNGVWVFDRGNARVLGFTDVTTSFPSADVVVGANDFVTPGSGSSPTTLSVDTNHNQPSGIATSGTTLLVADASNNRTLLFSPQPTGNGSAAGVALGQSSTSGGIANSSGAGNLNLPSAVWTDGTRVAVADRNNNRVLIWNTFPTTNMQPADVVLGQAAFGQAGYAVPPTASSMHFPGCVYSDGTRFYVCDTNDNRVLIWNSFPTVNGQAPNVVVGQSGFTTSSSGNGPAELAEPASVAVAGNNLIVADTINHRVLVYAPIPSASGAAAKLVLGQSSLSSNTAGTSQNALNQPMQVLVDDHKLYVSDYGNNRVLTFGLSY